MATKTPEWWKNLNGDQKFAALEDLRIKSANQDKRIEELETTVQALQSATKKLFATTPARSTRQAPALHSCDATEECVGHKEEWHIQAHRDQVARKLQAA